MTPDQLLDTVSVYRDTLNTAGYRPFRSDNHLERAMWMCEQIPVFVAEGRVEMARRWLGFVEGILWCKGMHTIAELKLGMVKVERREDATGKRVVRNGCAEDMVLAVERSGLSMSGTIDGKKYTMVERQEDFEELTLDRPETTRCIRVKKDNDANH